MNYGLPYMGSKNKLIPWLMSILPAGDTFVDLFCGGCSVTHAAMLSGKYNHFIINDINPLMPQAFVDALSGKYKGEHRWVSREEFFLIKDKDMYARLCFSFGNEGNSYCYSKSKEPKKRAIHYAIIFNDWREVKLVFPAPVVTRLQDALSGKTDLKQRRLAFYKALNGNTKYSELQSLQSLERLQSLESLERLQSLQSLESLERLQSLESLESLERLQSLESLSLDFGLMEKYIPDKAIVYCDPPYFGTKEYGVSFDYKSFYDFAFALSKRCDTYISEYNIPDKRFHVIAQKQRFSLMSGGSKGCYIEKIFKAIK